MSASHTKADSSHGSHGPKLPAEPVTPIWLPALGAALFALGGGYFIYQQSTLPPETGANAEIAAATAAASVAPPPAQPVGAPGAGAQGAGQPRGGSVHKPEDLAKLLKQAPGH